MRFTERLLECEMPQIVVEGHVVPPAPDRFAEPDDFLVRVEITLPILFSDVITHSFAFHNLQSRTWPDCSEPFPTAPTLLAARQAYLGIGGLMPVYSGA
jgi:hypothetical protein